MFHITTVHGLHHNPDPTIIRTSLLTIHEILIGMAANAATQPLFESLDTSLLFKGKTKPHMNRSKIAYFEFRFSYIKKVFQ